VSKTHMPARLVLVAALALLPRSASARPAGDNGPPPSDLTGGCKTGEVPAADCAAHYYGLYEKVMAAEDAAEYLFEAAAFYETDGSVVAAIRVYEQLRAKFPRSSYAPAALARIGIIHGNVGDFELAARALEQYAMLYAGEKDASDAMRDAIFYRKAIGDDAKAIENTKYLIKAYGAKRPSEAANADFALTALYEKRGNSDLVAKHLMQWIRTWGAKGGTDKLIIANGKLAELAWMRSCPVKLIDGMCAQRLKLAKPGVCSGTLSGVEPVKRNERELKRALASFAEVTRLYGKVGGSTGGDDAAARYYYARAKLAVADADAEPHIHDKKPASADLDTWFGDAIKLRTRYNRNYELVLGARDASTSIAAAARISLITDTLASAITDAATTKPECDAMAEKAAPLREASITGYGVCLSKAGELGWFDESAQICERALVRLAPKDYPTLREHSGDATNTSPVMATEPPPKN